MAWLSGWTHRKKVTLSRASGAVTNYQMKLLVGESSGAIGEDVNCEGNCKSDFSDLRFTTSDEETLLSYYIESITGVTPNQIATVWVEFNSIGTGATTFYMYYGKADATAVSDIDDAFIFGDDLSQDTAGNDPSKWTVSQGTLSLLKVQADALASIDKTVRAFNATEVRVTPDGTVWAGHATDGTVRKSTDGGASWTTKYTFSVGSGLVRCIFIAANGYIYASRDDSDILVRSIDGGENWATCLTLSGSGDSVVWHMTQDSLGYLYVGEYSTGDGTENSAYVYRSVDNGANWTTIWNNPDSARHMHIIAVDPYTDKLYISQDGGSDATKDKLLSSDDRGDNWSTLGSNGYTWMPTSVAFGSGYRLFGGEGFTGSPSTIKKTTNDSVFNDVYTPPAGDDEVFWNGGEVNEGGLIIFSGWTQKDNERATIIGTNDGGTTWRIFDWEATGVGNRGFLSVSNVDPSGYFYISRSVEGDIIRCRLEISVGNKIKAISPDTTQATADKVITFPASKFVVEHFAAIAQTNAVLTPVYVRNGATDRIAVAFWNDALIKYHNGTDWISSGVTYITNRLYRFKYIVHLSSGIWDLFIDGVSIATSIPFRNAGTTADRLWIGSGAVAQGNNYYDLFTVRNYSSPEPAWGSWGIENTLFDESLTLASSGDLSGGPSSILSPSLAIGSLSSLLASGVREIEGAIDLGAITSMPLIGTRLLDTLINLVAEATISISIATGISYEDALDLSVLSSLVNLANMAMSANANLVGEAAFTPAAAMEVGVSLGLNAAALILRIAGMTISGSVGLSGRASLVSEIDRLITTTLFNYEKLKLKVPSQGPEGSFSYDKIRSENPPPPDVEGDFQYKKVK
jgi:hypothetical protein